MDKRKTVIASIVFGLSILITLLTFFIIFNTYSSLRKAGLFFIILSEFIVYLFFITSDYFGKKTNKLFFNAGILVISLLNFLVTFISTAIFMVINKGIRRMVLIDCIFLTVFGIVAVLIFYVAFLLGRKNTQLLINAGKIKNIEVFFSSLRNNPKNSEYYSKLDRLYEAAKYCDNSMFTSTDEEITSKAHQLEALLGEDAENKNSLVNEALDDLLSTYKRRTEEARASKHGGI